MGSNWKTTKLLDHYDIRSGLSKPANDFGSGYPFLTFKDVFYNYFTPDELGDLVQSNDKERENCSVKRGDVFLTRTSETMHELGMSCVALQNYENATFNGFCKRLRPHQNSELVPEYIGYYLRSFKFRQSMLAFSTMSTRASLNNEMIGRLEISYPPKDEQIEIARVLKNLDDKITLNRQINQTLEQMAQALFKSWFVDFDPVVDNALDAGFFEQDLEFPDELLRRVEARKTVRGSADFKPLPDTILQLFPASFEECAESTFGLGGWVPRGWAVMPLYNVTSLIIDHRGKTPKKLGGDWSEKGHPAISAKNIKNGRLVRHDTIRCVDSDLYVKWMKDPLLASDILMTSEAPLGELLYLVKDSDYLLSQRLYGIRANKEIISGCYLYFWLQTNVAKADIDGRATGTTVVGIRQSELKKVNVMVPQKTVVDSFSNLAACYLAKIESNEKQSMELQSLRDILLPKLISGELRLSDSEVDTAEEILA